MSRLRFALLAAVAALLVQFSLGMPVALAASDTASQNPDLTVSLTVPDQALIGETIDAMISITNNSSKLQMISVKGIWTEPSGDSTVQAKSGLLLPGQTVTRVINYVVSDKCMPGTQQITLSVESKSGTSTATAPVEVIG
jgi:hypothetical protein